MNDHSDTPDLGDGAAEQGPVFHRWSDGEAVVGLSFPVLTADSAYWQHLPLAEIVSDPTHGRGLGLRLVRGSINASDPDRVLRDACDLLVLSEHTVGAVVGVNYSPVTGHLRVDLVGSPDAPVYDVVRISEWDLTKALLDGLDEHGTLAGLADRIEANAAAASATLRSFRAAGFGLADLALPHVIVSELGWPGDDVDIELFDE